MQTKTPADAISREIVESGGVISFFRFMELALYCPNLGYYEAKKDSIGRRGDFYTSVSVGSLFGQLLAFQFAEWLEQIKVKNSQFKIIEAGAHNGRLAADVVAWLELERPALFDQLTYIIIEPSEWRRQWQRETLKNFGGKVQWQSDFGTGPVNGIIFSNELLDAFPVHRFGWDSEKKSWFEWGVSMSEGKFIWTGMRKPGTVLPPFIAALPSTLLDLLPEGYSIEHCPAAEEWWRAAAARLDRGKLMTVDYGLTDDELLLPSRKDGTLRAYFQHRFSDDPLANPGQQDLTAHVNFSAIQRAGEGAGLKAEFFSSQANFLTQILEQTVKAGNFGEWDSARGRQFQTLTHPEHLGRAFRVLVQSR